MRKEIVFFIFITFLSLVASMEDSITVKTKSGDYVKLYAWKAGGGPLFVMKEGIAKEDAFTTTFFSVNEEKVKYQVIILRNGEKIRDEVFDDYTTSEPLLINCLPEICTISIYNESESSYKSYDLLEINSSNLLSEETVKLNESKESESFSNFHFKEYIISNFWVIGAFFLAIILFIVILFVVLFFRKRERFYDKEEKELEELQRKIKEKSEEIKKIKEEKFRKQKIDEAKSKLAEEEREIKELKERQINEAKKILAEKETELKRLKEDESKVIPENRNNQKEVFTRPVIKEEIKRPEIKKEPENKVISETKEPQIEKKSPLYDTSLKDNK